MELFFPHCLLLFPCIYIQTYIIKQQFSILLPHHNFNGLSSITWHRAIRSVARTAYFPCTGLVHKKEHDHTSCSIPLKIQPRGILISTITSIDKANSVRTNNPNRKAHSALQRQNKPSSYLIRCISFSHNACHKNTSSFFFIFTVYKKIFINARTTFNYFYLCGMDPFKQQR